MYEAEANLIKISGSDIPPEILARFAESRKTVTRRTLIPWGEHCTECVWPTCYTSCDLYSPRTDGKCRRFVHGMVRVDCPNSLNSYLLKISFKRWAKLWSAANLKLYPLQVSDSEERRDLLIAKLIGAAPGPLSRALIHKRYSLKKRRMQRKIKVGERPNCLLIESYNENAATVALTVTIRRDEAPIPYQVLLRMEPGFNRHRVPVQEIERLIDLSLPFSIELTPNEIAEGTTLYFGALDFVIDNAFEKDAAASKTGVSGVCKCVVWDLDNTLWDGILIEDGPERLRLKPGIVEVLRQLDERGILISAASKNNPEDAMDMLRRFQIDEYFLHPQISWEPKGQAIKRIAAALNIGIDSLIFVDDSLFEREEVKSVCPEVAVLDAAEYQSILTRPECQVPITVEGRKRRLLYRNQESRESALKDFHGEYVAFLRDCQLHLTICPMREENVDRVHELTQRTNQMNFSGNRYSRNQLLGFLKDSGIDTYVLDCEDRFGNYGTIGFCLINRADTRMTDLMFSCRIQGKRVEHGFVSYLIRKYRRSGASALLADYRKTTKNAATGRVFDDLGFDVLEELEGVTKLAFASTKPLSTEGILRIDDRTGECVATGQGPDAVLSSIAGTGSPSAVPAEPLDSAH